MCRRLGVYRSIKDVEETRGLQEYIRMCRRLGEECIRMYMFNQDNMGVHKDVHG